MGNTIRKVWIEHLYDDDPYIGWIGKYTDEMADWAICVHCGEYVIIAEASNKRIEEIEEEIDESISAEEIKRLKAELKTLKPHDCPTSSKEYNYFLPEAGGEQPGSDKYQKYGKQDFQRMEGLNNGNWYFLGIIAKASIRTTSTTLQVIHSGGLWDVESDCDKKHLEEIEQEQLDSLKFELMTLGFGKQELNRAFRNVEKPE